MNQAKDRLSAQQMAKLGSAVMKYSNENEKQWAGEEAVEQAMLD